MDENLGSYRKWIEGLGLSDTKFWRGYYAGMCNALHQVPDADGYVIRKEAQKNGQEESKHEEKVIPSGEPDDGYDYYDTLVGG